MGRSLRCILCQKLKGLSCAYVAHLLPHTFANKAILLLPHFPSRCDWSPYDDSFVPMQFIVKRKGLDCTEYGLVDGHIAKRQRLATDADTEVNSPVTLEMVEDYEAFVKSFKRTVYHCMDEKGVLELGEFLLKLLKMLSHFQASMDCLCTGAIINDHLRQVLMCQRTHGLNPKWSVMCR